METGARSQIRVSQDTQLELVHGIGICLFVVFFAPQVFGAEDNGFFGIRWGTRLADVADLLLIESDDRIQTFELKSGPPQLGEAKVGMLRFVAIEGEFARVSIHYSGAQNHAHILTYLQSQFGPIERVPGSMLRGLNQQFTWRTPNTEVNLTYNSYQERGIVFIESRTLAPRFNDVIPESAY